MNIELLADNTDFLPLLVKWYEREWSAYYGFEGPGNAHVDLTSRCNRDAVPIGFVAKRNDDLLGVAALDLDAATNLTPSVVGLLVAEPVRRRGVASKLLRSATRLAGRLGYNQLYISTNVIGEHLLRNGWRRIGDAAFLNGEHGSSFAFDLPPSR